MGDADDRFRYVGVVACSMALQCDRPIVATVLAQRLVRRVDRHLAHDLRKLVHKVHCLILRVLSIDVNPFTGPGSVPFRAPGRPRSAEPVELAQLRRALVEAGELRLPTLDGQQVHGRRNG